MRSIGRSGFCLLLAVSASAQNYGGGYRGAPGSNLRDAISQSIAQDEARRASNAALYARAQAAQHFVPRDPWRALNGTTNYVKAGGVEFCGRVVEITGNSARLDGAFGPLFTTTYDPAIPNHTSFIVTNLPPGLAGAGMIRPEDHLMAWDLGPVTLANGAVTERLDYGIPCPAPPPSPEQLEAARSRKDAERQRWWQVQSNTVRLLSTEASSGDAGAQYSLAMHYLNGVGCETNRDQAIYWLQKSSAQEYVEASNKLAVLQTTATTP